MSKKRKSNISKIRSEYIRQYNRVQRAVNKMNKVAGFKAVTNPLPAPTSVKRVTKKLVQMAIDTSTRSLAKDLGGYRAYRTKLSNYNARIKKSREASQGIQPTPLEVPPITPQTNLSRAQASQIAYGNLLELISQYNTKMVPILLELVQRKVAQMGVDGFVAHLLKYPELYTIAEGIAAYEGNVNGKMDDFVRLLDIDLSDDEEYGIQRAVQEESFDMME